MSKETGSTQARVNSLAKSVSVCESWI